MISDANTINAIVVTPSLAVVREGLLDGVQVGFSDGNHTADGNISGERRPTRRSSFKLPTSPPVHAAPEEDEANLLLVLRSQPPTRRHRYAFY